jgi:hypothetical protein
MVALIFLRSEASGWQFLSLQPAHCMRHRRRDIRVATDDLPASRFTAMDVGDSTVQGELLPGNVACPRSQPNS